jgi:hypothetical protein
VEKIIYANWIKWWNWKQIKFLWKEQEQKLEIKIGLKYQQHRRSSCNFRGMREKIKGKKRKVHRQQTVLQTLTRVIPTKKRCNITSNDIIEEHFFYTRKRYKHHPKCTRNSHELASTTHVPVLLCFLFYIQSNIKLYQNSPNNNENKKHNEKTTKLHDTSFENIVLKIC